MKNIYFEFQNPVITGTKMLIDIVANSDDPLKLAGINLRFFYDTRLFKPALTTNTDFKLLLLPGYKKYNEFNGNSSTGWAMFGSTGPITYVNTAVELSDPSKAISMHHGWVKVLQVQLTLKNPLVGDEFCPSFFFDKKFDRNTMTFNGGFFPGSDGLTCSEYLDTHAGEMITAPLIENANTPFNWRQSLVTKAPWGVQTQTECFISA